MIAAGVVVVPDDIAAVDAVGVGTACPRHIECGVGRTVITEAVSIDTAVVESPDGGDSAGFQRAPLLPTQFWG